MNEMEKGGLHNSWTAIAKQCGIKQNETKEHHWTQVLGQLRDKGDANSGKSVEGFCGCFYHI